jgi:hypothetical protein
LTAGESSMLNRYAGQQLRPRWGKWLALALAIGALAVPSAALAASPTEKQYGTTPHQIEAAGGGGGPSGGGGPTAPTSPSSGSKAIVAGLPFTGFDVGVLALAAVALLGTGVTLRRLSDPSRRTSS